MPQSTLKDNCFFNCKNIKANVYCHYLEVYVKCYGGQLFNIDLYFLEMSRWRAFLPLAVNSFALIKLLLLTTVSRLWDVLVIQCPMITLRTFKPVMKVFNTF